MRRTKSSYVRYCLFVGAVCLDLLERYFWGIHVHREVESGEWQEVLLR